MSLHYGTDGYVFATDYDSNITAHRVKPELIGKNFANFKDKNGVYLFNDLVKQAKKRWRLRHLCLAESVQG